MVAMRGCCSGVNLAISALSAASAAFRSVADWVLSAEADFRLGTLASALTGRLVFVFFLVLTLLPFLWHLLNLKAPPGADTPRSSGDVDARRARTRRDTARPAQRPRRSIHC